MYGFGDDIRPNENSVDLLETYVQEFITNLVTRATKRSQRLGSREVKINDIIRVLKQDEKKYLRLPYVLTMTMQLKKAKDDMNTDEKGNIQELKYT